MHGGANVVASRTPDHGLTAAGGRHRKAPTGAAAYGMPRHCASAPTPMPETVPAVVCTTRPDEASADPPLLGAAASTTDATITSATCKSLRIMAPPRPQYLRLQTTLRRVLSECNPLVKNR